MAQLKDASAHAAATVSSWGFVISPEQIMQTAKDIGEPSVLNRAGGAPTLAVGIAHVFPQSAAMGRTWASGYHFGILFEALFHPHRAGRRYPWQAALCCRICWVTSCRSLEENRLSGGGRAGYRGLRLACGVTWLYQGVVDPLGGVKSLWPLFGISKPDAGPPLPWCSAPWYW
ncbi:carbon starvation protein CstA [Enterobacter cloacae]|uniref:Carbon starvation protein CstA n=1 Tax=Enterobacter cloacae TaxID=550 RepID=A0A377M6P9_ENTCL|nr:carbon starvation protein CstA [Enterobacter cloacae]